MTPVVCSTCNSSIELYAGKWLHSWELAKMRAAAKVEHHIRTKLTAGGSVEVWCVCGKWRGTAPSIRVAQRDGQKHVESKREDSTDGN